MDLRDLLVPDSISKILFVIADGLGGLANHVGLGGERRGTELEVAYTPQLDRLARSGTTGLHTPVAAGVTPGSGPGHLALFGYDPLAHDIGRGVLSALGVGFELEPNDLAARGNFCTVDQDGVVVDRRAGRIDSERGAELADKLRGIRVEGAEVFVEPVKAHRFLLVLRGDGLPDAVADTDPQRTGVRPREPESSAVASFVAQARSALEGEHPANMVLLRGFDRRPELPSMWERYGLDACAVAGYPMYRGIARLLGMEVAPCGSDLGSEIEALRRAWDQHDFFFLHYKATDEAGEDGDFGAKVEAIEALDRHLPRIFDLRPEVIVVTGDHSTPSQLKSHSWHPVPLLLAASTCRRDRNDAFGETACARGGLGRLRTTELMPLALAHAQRLRKYGA